MKNNTSSGIWFRVIALLFTTWLGYAQLADTFQETDEKSYVSELNESEIDKDVERDDREDFHSFDWDPPFNLLTDFQNYSFLNSVKSTLVNLKKDRYTRKLFLLFQQIRIPSL